MKINKKLFKIIQSIIIVTIFFLAFKELYKIFVDIDINLFAIFMKRRGISSSRQRLYYLREKS